MKRKLIKEKQICEIVADSMSDMYNKEFVQKATSEVLKVLVEEYQRGSIIDFGIGRTYLKLRKNNSNFSPSKPYSVVFRGDVKDEVSDPIVNSSMTDEEFYKLFYTKKGYTNE